jgi:hypothetical protein
VVQAEEDRPPSPEQVDQHEAELKKHGKGSNGWFPLSKPVVSYDHPHFALLEEAIRIDFVNHERSPGARAAVELTLDSAKALNAALTKAIEAAEIEESGRARAA